MDVRFMILGLALASPAAAQQVHKCVDGNEVSYQSAPCSSGTSAKTWEAVPATEPSAAEAARLQRIRNELAASNSTRTPSRVLRPGVETRTGEVSARNQCDQVKAQRAAAYERVGMKRSFRFSSQWDNRVQQACR